MDIGNGSGLGTLTLGAIESLWHSHLKAWTSVAMSLVFGNDVVDCLTLVAVDSPLC